jgi:hypothetical protein
VMSVRRVAILIPMLAAACGAPGSTIGPATQIVPGTYTGSDSAGGLVWTIQQSGSAVSGNGTFLASGSTTLDQYSLRGMFVGGVLELRLVGAPGDADADSVWFSGRAVPELYSGAAFSGSLYGPTAVLFGQLSMYVTDAP